MHFSSHSKHYFHIYCHDQEVFAMFCVVFSTLSIFSLNGYNYVMRDDFCVQTWKKILYEWRHIARHQKYITDVVEISNTRLPKIFRNWILVHFNSGELWPILFEVLVRWRQANTLTMASQWVGWRLKSPASRLFTQPFIRAQIKENIKAPRHWPLCGEFTGDRWIPRTNGQQRGNCFHLMTSSCLTHYRQSSLTPYGVYICKRSYEEKTPFTNYRQISNISRTKSEILNVSCLVSRLSLSNPLKPRSKSRMKM